MKAWLKALRYEKKLRQQDVAQAASISRQFYNLIENDSRRPSPEAAKRIAGVLGFPDKWYMLLENAPAEQMTLFSG